MASHRNGSMSSSAKALFAFERHLQRIGLRPIFYDWTGYQEPHRRAFHLIMTVLEGKAQSPVHEVLSSVYAISITRRGAPARGASCKKAVLLCLAFLSGSFGSYLRSISPVVSSAFHKDAFPRYALLLPKWCVFRRRLRSINDLRHISLPTTAQLSTLTTPSFSGASPTCYSVCCPLSGSGSSSPSYPICHAGLCLSPKNIHRFLSTSIWKGQNLENQHPVAFSLHFIYAYCSSLSHTEGLFTL